MIKTITARTALQQQPILIFFACVQKFQTNLLTVEPQSKLNSDWQAVRGFAVERLDVLQVVRD